MLHYLYMYVPPQCQVDTLIYDSVDTSTATVQDDQPANQNVSIAFDTAKEIVLKLVYIRNEHQALRIFVLVD